MTPRSDLFPLIRGCPFGTCAEGCPLKPYRDLPREEAYAKLISVGAAEIAELEEHHLQCVGQRQPHDGINHPPGA